MANELKFLKGLYTNWTSLTKNADSFYIVEHRNESNEFVKYDLYLGDKFLCDGVSKADLATAVTNLVNGATEGYNTLGGLETKVKALESAVGEGGSVAAQIKAAIEKLDATVTSDDGGFVTVQVTETDGKLTAVSVTTNNIAKASELDALEAAVGEGFSSASTVASAIAANKADIDVIKGEGEGSIKKAVADAKTELLGGATAGYDTLGGLEQKVKDVAKDAKSYEIKAITSGLSANVQEAYALFDEDGTQAGATINIYKDSALQSVELVSSKPAEGVEGENGYVPSEQGQFLKFIYLTTEGEENVVYINVSSFLAESEFGNGLDVVGGVVSVNVANATKANTSALVDSGKNFLELEADGDGNQALAVRSIDTDSTVLQKDIVVAGISGQFGAGNYENNDVIPAGTDIYTILQNILCKELYPTAVNSTQGNITSSVEKPTISLSQSGTVTYGTPCTLNSITCGALSVTPSASKVTGLTWGYSSADDDSADSTSTIITKNVTSSITDATYDLAVSFTGFNGQTSMTATGEGKDECKIESTALGFITMGNNIISVTQTGPAVKGEIEKIESGYTVSNLGNTDASKKYSAVAALSKQLDRPTSSNSKTITGVLPCFYNLSNGELVDDATVQMSLITDKTFTDISVPSEGVAKKHFMFDFPADRKVSTFKVKDLQGNYVTFEAAYTQDTEVEKEINGIKMNYKRLQTTGDFVGDGVYRIELSKKLNTATINDVVKNN